eukprot:g2540.t1
MLSDMWRFHLETKTWFPIDYGEEGPEGRWKEGATPVYNNSQLVLMGGCTKTSVKFSRTGHGRVADVFHRVSGLLLNPRCHSHVSHVVPRDDLWVFSPEKGRWRRVPTENTPVRRRGHVLVANHTHLIMFGGKSTKQDAQESYDELEDEGLGEKVQPGEKCLIDLWAIPKDRALEPVLADTSEVARWTEGAPFPATCRWGATGSYVRDHDGKTLGRAVECSSEESRERETEKYLAFFGGRHLGAFQAEHTDRSAYVYYNDLWLYDFVKDRWGEAPTIGRRPPARDHHGAATLEDQIFIYGGRCSEKREKTSVLADVWSYSLTTLRWTLHEPVGSAPAARFMPGVSDVIYKGRPHLAIFAGETLPGSTKRTTLNDVWVFDPKEAPWSELFASTCSEEPGLEAGELAGPNVQALLCLATGFGFVFTLFMLMRTFGRRAQAKEMQAPLLE